MKKLLAKIKKKFLKTHFEVAKNKEFESLTWCHFNSLNNTFLGAEQHLF